MTTAITLESLGLSQEEITERVVESIVHKMLYVTQFDEDGESYEAERRDFSKQIHVQVKERIVSGVEEIAAKHVLPNMKQYIEDLVLQETNSWGTAKGEPVTFIEYLVGRAENYMTEEVNYDGKTKSGNGYASWKGTQTRIAYLINRHLHYSIETAMQDALKTANSAIMEGIEETVKIKLAEVVESLKVEVKTK